MKSIEKVQRKSVQNAANARKRWGTKSYEKDSSSLTFKKKHTRDANASPPEDANASAFSLDANASEGKDSAYLLNNSVPEQDKSKIESKRLKEKSSSREANVGDLECDRMIMQELEKYLSEEQIKRVVRICELNLEYVQEKIVIMKGRKPSNQSAFLYAALTQDYRPGEKEQEKKKKAAIHPLIRKAMRLPLNQEEFEELPAKLQKKLQAEDHMIPESIGFELKTKPHDGGNVIERVIFNNMEIGEIIEQKQFDQLSREHQSHFESINRPAGKVNRYHLR